MHLKYWDWCPPPAAVSRVGPVEGLGAAGTLWASDSRWAALVRGGVPLLADRSSWEVSQEDTFGRSSKAPETQKHTPNHQEMTDNLLPQSLNNPEQHFFSPFNSQVWHRPVDQTEATFRDTVVVDLWSLWWDFCDVENPTGLFNQTQWNQWKLYSLIICDVYLIITEIELKKLLGIFNKSQRMVF